MGFFCFFVVFFWFVETEKFLFERRSIEFLAYPFYLATHTLAYCTSCLCVWVCARVKRILNSRNKLQMNCMRRIRAQQSKNVKINLKFFLIFFSLAHFDSINVPNCSRPPLLFSSYKLIENNRHRRQCQSDMLHNKHTQHRNDIRFEQ